MAVSDVDLTTLTAEELDREIQLRGEERLECCYLALFEDIPEEELTSPPDALFCGCITCEVREIANAIWEPMKEAARREVLGNG